MSRLVKDYLTTVNRALPTADGTVTSSDIDLGAVVGGAGLENVNLTIEIPALNATQLPTADTLTVTVQGGAAAAPTTSLNMVRVFTSSSGLAATTWSLRLPPDCPRYINVKFVAAGGTGDISASTAIVALRY